MKIISMELDNFRQYMGKQKIEFASEEKNITIIFGENGKGKTGIFRALMFALYGSTHIQQDNPNEPVHLVSMKLLDESKRPTVTTVKVSFEHLGNKYEVSRSLKGIKRGDRIEERFNFVKLIKFDENGNYGSEILDDELKVRSKMNEILDEEIKDFFLFDGEKIDTLAKTNDSVKKEVRTAIFKLLQINNLEEAKNLVESLYRSERNSIIKNAQSGNIDEKEKEIESIKEKIESKKSIQQQLLNEQIENKKLIDHYELQLSQNEDIRRIQERLRNLQESLSDKNSHQDDLKSQATELLKKDIPFLLMDSVFPNVTNYLEQVTNDQKSIVNSDVLDISLSSGVCACCNNDLTVHKDNLLFVQSLRDNYRRSELVTMSSSLKNLITDKGNFYLESEQQIIKVLRKINELEVDRKEILGDIDIVNKEIGSRANAELHLEQIKNSLEIQREKQTSTRINIEKLKEELSKLDKELDKAEEELSELFKNNKSLEFDSKVIDIIGSIKENITDISEEFSTSMRFKLRDLTTEIFKRLIDRKDISLISKININEKFELEIIGQDGIDISQDISQGQRQIVALAFITALAQIASGDNLMIAFPLFMDSPFNRLSANNRDQLIVNIPLLTSQWILLLTDTELTVNEERVFKENNKLGKFYKIVQNDVMDAVIESVGLNEPLSTRGI